MSRFETKFAELAAKKEGAFVPFVTLCDPTFDRSFEIICTLVENGADALELGFPFSDPLLDGPVIQAANNRALNAGHSTEDSLNLIFAKGLDNFYQRCAEVGVDAVLVADIPLLAKEDYVQAAKKHGIQPVFICPPNADEKTVQGVAENSEGYTYLVSRAGVTSAENQAHAANLDTLVEQLKAHKAPPILQGFGIAQPAQVKEALQLGATGAISGSATVKIIERNLDNQAQCLSELAEFVRNMKTATK